MAESAVEPTLTSDRSAVEAALLDCCGRIPDDVPSQVREAIRYSLLSGGKRLRAALVIEAYRAAGGIADPVPLAAAVEVVHAYSLVHDDLPCMDDDDMRRGRPSVHRVFGVATATAAGLAMVPLAVRCAVASSGALGLSAEEGGAIVRELMAASGSAGMIGGQLLDLDAEGKELSLAQLERIHRRKTGALISAAVRIGALAARGDADAMHALARYGAAIGLAFQIADDVLDVTATSRELGKTAGRDVVLRKSTYPGLLGVEGARLRADALVNEACAVLAERELLSAPLERIARFTVRRRS